MLYYERNGEIYSVSRRDVQIQLDAASVKDAIQGQSNLNTVAVEGGGHDAVPLRSFQFG